MKPLLIAAFLIVSGAVYAEPIRSPDPSDVPVYDRYNVEVLAENFNRPWGLGFLPDGRMLIAERSGGIQLLSADGSERVALSNVPKAYIGRQAGFFEALPHPDYTTNGWIYLSYAWGTDEANGLRIARAQLDDSTLTNIEVLFTVAPLKEGGAHYGGRIAFLPDGTFAVGTGEGYNYREDSQKLDSLMGKVIRLNADGSIPSDNPFINDENARPEIWSYGHRNPQGLLYDDVAGILYLHEHGPRGGDEINVIEPGLNYGWPAITYGIEYSGAQVSPYTELPNMEQPLLYWVPSIAPSGFVQLRDSQFTQWDGDFLVSTLAGKELRYV
ncbi:MAG: PQQ-dependent sugar dehydrogenase, partial [Gammaproteobacteria bacterium]|nr:PQQ-dependent sugar dehydrogenase [Gammaproteobacteria bacterium]